MPDPASIHVLMLNYEFPPFGGGTGRSCAALLGELPRQPGIRVDLITSGPVETLERWANLPNLAIHRLDVGKLSRDFWTTAALEAQAAAGPTAEPIHFTGHLEGPELDEQIMAADMLVLPSAREAAVRRTRGEA